MKNKQFSNCTECGNETPKWAGKCTSCGAWNTLVEAPVPAVKTSAKTGGTKIRKDSNCARSQSQIGFEQELRFSTVMAELDRVLGGGAVRGSLVLVGGAPGIVNQLFCSICGLMAKMKKPLCTGEESSRQLRCSHCGSEFRKQICLCSETDIGAVIAAVEELKPCFNHRFGADDV